MVTAILTVLSQFLLIPRKRLYGNVIFICKLIKHTHKIMLTFAINVLGTCMLEYDLDLNTLFTCGVRYAMHFPNRLYKPKGNNIN